MTVFTYVLITGNVIDAILIVLVIWIFHDFILGLVGSGANTQSSCDLPVRSLYLSG